MKTLKAGPGPAPTHFSRRVPEALAAAAAGGAREEFSWRGEAVPCHVPPGWLS